MLNSVRLTLLIGPGLPVPAPVALTEALSSVTVTAGGERTGFQLKFTIGKKSVLQRLVAAGALDPGITRVIVLVTLGAVPEVLVDGVVTRQEMAPSNAPGQSTLTVTGEDLSVLMGVVEFKLIYPAMPVNVIVTTVLAKYAAFGIIPLVIPPIFDFTASPTESIRTQSATDLDYIKTLATQAGYVFYLRPGPAPGTSIAYWGPDIANPLPQPALSVNSDSHTNVESLSFSLDGLSSKIEILNTLDPVTKKIVIPIPVPNISILKPPLGARLTPPLKVEYSKEEAKDPTPKAVLRALSRAGAGADTVSGTGALNVLRYGHILRERRVVGVRGAGLAYDGLYFVKTVTHNIRRGEYKQNFSLARSGLVSNTPVVP